MPLFVGTRRILRPVPSSSSGGGDTPTYVANGGLVSLAGERPILDIAYYSGLAANDIGIVMVGGYVGGVGDYSYPSVSGWTLINNAQAAGGGVSLATYWKRLTGSESGTESFFLDSSSETSLAWGVMFGIRGCITSGTPYEDADEIAGVNASMTSQSITTTAANRLCLRMHYDEDAGTSSVPGSWTQRFEHVEPIGGYGTAILDTIAQASAGTVSASTRTAGFASNFVIHTMAMLPT